jgi:hypothetical protein
VKKKFERDGRVWFFNWKTTQKKGIDMIYRRAYPVASESSGIGSFLAGCLAGMAIGTAMGMLMAPHRGEITRRKIARRAEETRDQVVEAVEEALEDHLGKKEGDGEVKEES